MQAERVPLPSPRWRRAGPSARSLLAAGAALALHVPASPQALANAGSACRSATADAQLLAKETALLGRAHAAAHAQTRAQQCAAERGANTAPTRAPLQSPQATLRDDQAVIAAATDLAAGRDSTAARTSGNTAKEAKRQGRWSAPFPIPVLGIASVLLHTGKVLYWSYDPASWSIPSRSNVGVAFLWDPLTRQGKAVPPPDNVWCGAQTVLGDGRVFVAGGNLRYPDPSAPAGTTSWEGGFGTYTFSPLTESWTAQPVMAQGRWYPTATQLGNGTVVITSGYDQTGTDTITNVVEVFDPVAGTIAAVGNGTHAQSGLYPLQFLLPTGKVLAAGPGRSATFLLDPSAAWGWTALPAMSDDRYLGNGTSVTDASVTPPRQVVMVAGGDSGGAARGNQWMDGSNPGAGWRPFPLWQQGRYNANTVILADGSLLTVGGGQGPGLYDAALFEAELYTRPGWDTGGTWQTVAAPAIAATYHSSAMLLPDATVLLSQDDRDKTAQHSAQVYSPPYLFKGERIGITSAPAAASHGGAITVSLSRTGAAAALLVAPGATTHGNDMHQRAVKLPVSIAGATLTAQVPNAPNLLPPGYYMLFVLDVAGVPSVARFVQIT